MKFLMFLVPVLIWSCNPAESAREDEREALDRQLQEINSIIAEGSCAENDACQYIAVGSKACGGPKAYLVYSTSIDVDALEEKVEAYNQAEAEFNEKHNISSDCALVSPPENIGCEDGTCVIIE